MNYLITLLFLFLSLVNFSQKKIFDIHSKEIIPFVEIYSEEGKFLGSSDIDGKIPRIKILKLGEKVSLYHQNYESKKIIFQNFDMNTEIYLTPLVENKKIDLERFIIRQA